MMKSMLCSFLLASSIWTADCATKRSKKNANVKGSVNDGAERVRLLSDKFLVQNSVYLTDYNYSKFISSSREYVSVVMYTALSKNHQCDICKNLLPLFNDVASLYYSQFNFNMSLPKERLAFFIVDADSAGRTFEGMRLQTVPKFYIYPNKASDEKLKQDYVELNNRYVVF